MIIEKEGINHLDNITRIFVSIDYDYWMDYAKGEHDKYNGGVRNIVTQLVNNNLIPETDPIYQIANIDHLKGKEKKAAENKMKKSNLITMSNMEREAKKAAEVILKSFKEGNWDDLKLDSMFLRVFDLVQAWGGKSGRQPYVPSKKGLNDAPRIATSSSILKSYKKAVKNVIDGDINKAVNNFTSKDIKGVDMSFGTKHLWFWSEVVKDILEIGERQPVYDDRIARMILGVNRADKTGRPLASEKFKELATMVKKLGGKLDTDMKDIEVALFNFAGYYFGNEFENLKTDVVSLIEQNPQNTFISRNYNEAVALHKLRSGKILNNVHTFWKQNKIVSDADLLEKERKKTLVQKEKKKIDKEVTAKRKEKENSLKRFPTDIEWVDNKTLKLAGIDLEFKFDDYKDDLEREQMARPISQELINLRKILRTVDPNYLNDNWRDVQGYLI